MLRRALRGVVTVASVLLAGGSLVTAPAAMALTSAPAQSVASPSSASPSTSPTPSTAPTTSPTATSSAAPSSAAPSSATPSTISSLGTPTPRLAVGADGRLRIAVLVPITVPATVRGLLDAGTLASYTGQTGTLTRQLDAVSGHDVTLAIDPRIIASIRVLGSAAPESAIAWLQRLDLLPNEIFPLSYADADPAVISQAGLSIPLSPIGFDFALDPATFSPVDAGDSDLPSLPATIDDVLAWNYTAQGIAWPRDDSVVSADISTLSGQGYTRVIMTTANAGVAGPIASSPAGDAGVDAVVTDDALTAAMSAASTAPDDDTSAAVSALSTAVATAAADQGSSVRVVSVGRTSQSGGTGLATALDVLDADPSVTLIGLNSALGVSAIPAALVDMPAPQSRISAATRLLAAAAADTTFATVAVDPLAITAPRRLSLLALLSAEWGDGAVWEAAVTRSLTGSTDLRASVELVDSDVQLAIEQQTRLRVRVRNGLDTPIKVLATATPRQPVLTFDDSAQPLEIEVNPNSEAIGLIPTEAVSNGEVVVQMSITSATGVPIGPTKAVTVRVQAGWVTLGAFIIGGAVIVLFAVGLLRAIVRRRREAEHSGPDDAPDADPDPQPEPEPAGAARRGESDRG